MALLPGVPNVGPAPVSPMAHSAGKPGKTEHLGSVVGRTGKGLTNIGGGDSALHSLNHYGKGGIGMIRGGSGSMKRNVRSGGLGPGFAGTAGPSDTNYSMQSEDTE